MKARPDGTVTVAVGVAATTFAWGATRCGDSHFWVDEAYTAAISSRPLGDLVETLRHEGGMGPYYLVLWGWEHLGTSEWWLRLLSVAGGAATVAAVFLFTAHHAGRKAAVIAVALMVCNPYFLYFLTELRAYSWSMFASVVATWAYLRMREYPTGRTAVAYGVAAGMSLALLVFSAGVIAAHAACSARMLRTAAGRRALLIAAAVAAGLFLPWLPAILSSNQLAWIAPTTAGGIVRTVTDALGGTKWVLVLGAGALALAVSLAVRVRSGRADPAMTAVLAGSVAMPLALIVMSLARPVLLARYLAPMFPLAVIAAAVGATRAIDSVASARAVRIGAAVAVAGACTLGFRGSLFTDMPRPEDMYGPAAQLNAEVRTGDVVAFGEPLEQIAIGWYWDEPDLGTADGGIPVDVCRIWFVSRDVTLLSAMTAIAAPEATITTTGYDGWGVVLIDDCG